MANGDRDDPKSDDEIPSLFATIHFRSERRPDGYTDEEIVELNEQLDPAVKNAG